MQVLNNVSAFSVWKSYTKNVDSLQRSMSKLSSGLKIDRASDDAAGLAVSERLRSQYRNSAAAGANIQNKLSYLQTADNWLQTIHDIMGRMAELAVSANDGTKGPGDRVNLQEEFSQLQDEIKRITSGAAAAGKYNGLYLFRGGSGLPTATGDSVISGFGNVRLQIGPDTDQVFNEVPVNLTTTNFEIIGSFNSYSYGSVNLTLLGSSPTAVRWGSLLASEINIGIQSVANSVLPRINIGIDHISSIRASLGSEANRLEQTLTGLRNYENNIRASESRIRDVDVARESSEFTKFQILTQVGTAMLAQANTLPQGVVQLLG